MFRTGLNQVLETLEAPCRPHFGNHWTNAGKSVQIVMNVFIFDQKKILISSFQNVLYPAMSCKGFRGIFIFSHSYSCDFMIFSSEEAAADFISAAETETLCQWHQWTALTKCFPRETIVTCCHRPRLRWIYLREAHTLSIESHRWWSTQWKLCYIAPSYPS